MKKNGKVLTIILCCVAVFFLGLSLGTFSNVGVKVDAPSFSGQNNQTTTQPVVTQPAVQTTVPTETTSAPQTDIIETTASQAENDATTPAAPSEMSNADISTKINEAMSTLKSEQNFKATKTEKTVINITDCSASGLTNMLNSICQKVAGEKVTTFDFANGQAIGIGSDVKETNDGNPVSAKDAIPPKKADFKLNEAGIKDATVTKNGDSTTYTVTLISEESTIDKAPQNNADALGYLNLGGFEIPTVTITQADINYPGSTITVTVNGQGKVTEFKYEQPMEGTMGMKITLVSGTADFDGGNYETWQFEY